MSTHDELVALAEKVKSGTATKEEVEMFFTQFNDVVKALNEKLEEVQ